MCDIGVYNLLVCGTVCVHIVLLHHWAAIHFCITITYYRRVQCIYAIVDLDLFCTLEFSVSV